MKDMHCRDTGMSCQFVARGHTAEEVKREAAAHVRHAHGLHVTPEVERTIESLVHDEDSEAHRASAGRADEHVSNP